MQDFNRNFVSIVIPVHNQVEYTISCLRSLNASPPDIGHEIIIVDDGSTDDTRQYLSHLSRHDERIRVLHHGSATGFARSCNAGAATARGELLLFLNNDTEVQPGWFPPLHSLINSSSDIGIVAPKLIFPDGTIQHCGKVWSDTGTPGSHPHHIYYRFPSDHPAVNKSRPYMMVTGACIIMRTADFRAVGGFDERYENGWEDDDLCYAISSAGKRIHYCPESVVIHHQNKTLNERMDELKRRLPTPERLNELDALVERGTASPEQIQLARQVQATFHDMETELLRLRDKFHRNRGVFFEKWGSVIKRDAHIYCREDGVPLESALTDAAAGDSPPPQESDGCRSDIRSGGDEMPLVSIIILTRNRLDVTGACIASIRRHTPESHEIIFVDNGSTDGTVPWLRDLSLAQPLYRLIENRENAGFSAGCNQGMRAARGEFILLLNNDVVVTPEWLSGMLECFRDENIGIVGPMTNNISGPQQWPWSNYGKIERLDDFSREFRRNNRFIRIPCRRVVGFCMMFRRELLEKIGFLDEQFGSGNFEDDDYCIRAALEGFRNLIAADVFIHHVGSATFQGNNINYSDALMHNQQLFNRKWSRPVTEESLGRRIIRLKTLESAESLNQRGFADEAVNLLLNQGIGQMPQEPLFYRALAKLFLDAGMPGEALSVLQEYPVELPSPLLLLQFQALLAQGKTDEAISLFQESPEATDNGIDALLLRGYVMLARGDLHGAAKTFDQARIRYPSTARIYAGLAEVAHLAGDDRLCAELLERSFRLEPSDISIANQYQATLSTGDQFARAERFLAEARHFCPNSDTLACIHIDILLRLGRHQDAIEVIEHALVFFNWGEGFLDAAQSVREDLGPITISAGPERRGKSVSLCMIVKNEEKNLPRCLKSLLPVVDEIVIADTGSTDHTREIATIFGARVISVQWDGDYSTARNAALGEAAGDWILVMDADEVISPRDYGGIRTLVETSPEGKVAYCVTSRNYTNRVDLEKWRANRGEYPREEAGRGWMPSDKTRLFPNRPDIRFENPIHEMVEPALDRLGIPSIPAPFVVHHYGYLDDERQQRKLQQYYELGKRKMDESGDSPTAIVELAIQAAAVKKYDEAMSLWQRALAIDPNSSLAYFNLGHVYLQKGMFQEGSDAAQRAMALKDNYREAQVNYLLCQLCLGNIETSLKTVEEYLKANPDYPILLLMRGVLSAAGGDWERATAEFMQLRNAQVEFSNFIHDVTKKLIQAGQKKYAANLVAIAGKAGCCGEESILLVS